MSIIVNRKNDRITGSIEGNPFNILFDKNKYESLKVLSGRLEHCNSKETYADVLEKSNALIKIDFKEEVASVNGFLKYKPNTGKYYLVINKGKKAEKVSRISLPETLAERIVESYEEGSDYMPILLAWRRFLANPNYNEEKGKLFANYLTAIFVNQEQKIQYMEEEGMAEDTAITLSTYNDIAITSYGLLATYKVVDVVKKIWKLTKDENGKQVKEQVEAFPSTKAIDKVTGKVTKTPGTPKYLEEITFTPAIYKDGDNFLCGDDLGYTYKIGKDHVLPENAKRNYENTFGGGGLYAGGQAYIQGYSNDSTETLTCFIDPFDIISFQDDGHAFRTNRMFVNGAMMEGELEGMYFISDYAKESNTRMKEKFKEVLEITDALMKETITKATEDQTNVDELTK